MPCEFRGTVFVFLVRRAQLEDIPVMPSASEADPGTTMTHALVKAGSEPESHKTNFRDQTPSLMRAFAYQEPYAS